MAKLLSGTRIYGTATVDTQLFVSGSNVASSTITGALQVVGGAGVGGNLYVGGTIYGTVTTANNISAGTAGQLVYQTGPGATSFVGPGTAGQILLSSGTSAPVYTNTASIHVGRATLADSVTLANAAVTSTNVSIANETSASSAQYITFVPISTGSSVLKVSATTGLTYIPTTNYVGMGIATPTNPLHIVSSYTSIIKFRGATTGSIGVLYSDATQVSLVDNAGSNGFIILPNSSNVTLMTNATEAVRVDASQQVGINTTRPNYRLDVRGQTYIGAASTLSQLILGDTTNSTSATISTVNSDLIFSANGTAEAVRITSSKGIAFGGASNYGTSGQLLKSAGNASPVWVDQSTIAAGSVANSHTAGTGLTGSTYNGSAAVTWTLNTATLMTIAVTANNLAATATLGGSGYLYIGGYNTKPSAEIYPTPFTVNSTGPIAIADNFSGGGVEANIWNTVYPSAYASTGFRFQQLLTTGTYRDLVFFKNTGAIAFGGISNYGSSGQLLQSNGDSTATWISLTAVTVGKATTATNLAGGTSGQIPYQTGPGTTDFMTNANWNSSTNILSVTGTVQSTVFSRTGAVNASSWTTTSPTFNSAANAFNDTSTVASATVSARVAISFLDPSFTANNAGVVITDAVNLYVKAPVAGTNVSFTNNWGIYNQGNSFVGGSEKVTTSLAVGSYSITANAGDVLASGNGMFGYSTAQSGARLSVSGAGYINGILTATSVITTQGLTDVSGTNAALRVVSPGGASAWQGSSSVTGAIKIKLPTGITLANTMLRFTVKVYTYDGQSFDINCGGYTYTTAPGNWINTFAFMHTQSRAALAVRFGYDASTANYCVYIGELTTAWAYCNVFVTDFQAGYSNYAANQWNSGWAISWEASAFANVSATQTAYPWSSTAYSLTAGNGLSGGTFNGTAAGTFTNIGVTSAVAGTGITVSTSTGSVTIGNSGVTSIVAGTNISVSGATGAVTVNVSGTVAAATAATYARVLQQSDGTSFSAPTDPRGASGARGTDLAPNTYAYGLFSEFKNSSLYTGVNGNYAGLLTYANYNSTTASTGDPSYSLLFSPQAANSTLPPRLQLRAGIDTTWGKWSDILHSGNHASAAGAWTPNFTGGVRGYANGSFKKDSGNTNTWDGQVYSTEGYSTRVYCSFKAGETTTHIMAGLNSDPTTDSNYTSIDYAWYLNAGTIAIYEGGASIYSSGTYSVNDVFTITYDGTNVRYYYNDTLIRTVARSVSGTLYFDSSFYEVPCSLTSVAFGSTGVGGATGAALTLSSLGVGTAPSYSTGTVTVSNYARFGPNPTWAATLQVGGDGRNAITNASTFASVVTTNGNLHLDSGTDKAMYLNFYSGTGGVLFGNGASGSNASVSAAGVFTGNGSGLTNVTGTDSTKLPLAGGTMTGMIVGKTNTGGGYSGSNDSGSLSVRGDASNGAFISFHRPGAYAINMGLDTDNIFKIGGWSAGATYVGVSAGQLFATSEITAYYSDGRLKTNLGNITGALDAVTKLNGFRYTNNDLAKTFGYTDEKVQLGVNAQEVEALFPEIVAIAPFDIATDPETGKIISKSGDNYKTVRYEKLVPVLIEAIKEQQQQIAQLYELVNKLTNK